MGCWGVGSDENDGTWDKAGFGIMERAQGISLSEKGRSGEGMVKDRETSVHFDSPADLGMVIFCLKLGCPVPLPALAEAKAQLKNEEKGAEFPENIEERAKHVEEELAMIEEAVENGGSVPGDGDGEPIGVRGIVGGQTCNLEARRDSRLARHNAPKKACPSC